MLTVSGDPFLALLFFGLSIALMVFVIRMGTKPIADRLAALNDELARLNRSLDPARRPPGEDATL